MKKQLYLLVICLLVPISTYALYPQPNQDKEFKATIKNISKVPALIYIGPKYNPASISSKDRTYKDDFKIIKPNEVYTLEFTEKPTGSSWTALATGVQKRILPLPGQAEDDAKKYMEWVHAKDMQLHAVAKPASWTFPTGLLDGETFEQRFGQKFIPLRQGDLLFVEQDGKYFLRTRWEQLIALYDKKGSVFDNPWVNNVVQVFNAIPTNPTAKITVKDSENLLPGVYSASKAKVVFEAILDFLKIKERMEGYSHFQSIKRIPGTQYIYLTAGDKENKKAHLVIAALPSEKSGKWVTNDDATRDHVVKMIELPAGKFWHPGGMDICGKYLSIPLEGEDSKIVFYDVSQPDNPTKLAPEIVSENAKYGGCMATALARLPNLHYLLGVITNKKQVHLYYSKTTNLEDGFDKKPIAANIPHDEGNVQFGYQNISFITDADGSLYMVATLNSKNTSPIDSGDDYAELFKLVYNADLKEDGSLALSDFALKLIKSKEMDTGGADKSNFMAAANIYIKDQNSLVLFSAAHWVHDNGIRITVFEP